MGRSSEAARARLQRRREANGGGSLRVGIVGTGIAGETASYLLTHTFKNGAAAPNSGATPPPLYVARVYEARSSPGLHANSITVDGCNVDVPLRAVSPHYYANLFALYQHLNISLQSVDYSSCTSDFAENAGCNEPNVTDFPTTPSKDAATRNHTACNNNTPSKSTRSEPTFRYRNYFVRGHALPCLVWSDLFNLVKLVRAFLILRDLFFLVLTGPHLLKAGNLDTIPRAATGAGSCSLGDVLLHYRYSDAFVNTFLIPMLSTLLSCSYDQVDAYPAQYILEFFCSRSTTLLTGWFRVQSGVQEVSSKLLDALPSGSLKLNTPVASVAYDAAKDMVCVTEPDGTTEWFDAVLLATEPSVAQRLWTDRTKAEDLLMGSLQHYDANITVHTDERLLPPCREDWRGMNVFHLRNGGHRNGEGSPADDALANGDDTATPKQRGRGSGASMTSARLRHYHPTLHATTDDGVSSTPSSATNSMPPSPTQKAPRREVIETWNCYEAPADGSVLHDVRMTRAVWDGPSKSAYDRLFATTQGNRGVYLIGSYAEPGVTLLEQAVTSALHAAQDLGASVPFPIRPCYEQRLWVVWVSTMLHALWCWMELCRRWVVAVAALLGLPRSLVRWLSTEEDRCDRNAKQKSK